MLLRLPQAVSISGYTDAAPFRGGERSNWDLSSERANATRRLLAEAGVPGYEISTWYGIWAPARTPAEIVGRLQAAVARAVRGEEAKEKMAAAGAQPVADAPEDFARFVRAEHERWGRLVRDARIKAD